MLVKASVSKTGMLVRVVAVCDTRLCHCTSCFRSSVRNGFCNSMHAILMSNLLRNKMCVSLSVLLLSIAVKCHNESIYNCFGILKIRVMKRFDQSVWSVYMVVGKYARTVTCIQFLVFRFFLYYFAFQFVLLSLFSPRTEIAAAYEGDI